MNFSVLRIFLPSLLALAAFCLVLPLPAIAQTEEASGSSPTRTQHGHPNLEGIWQTLNTAAWNLEDHGASLESPAGHGVVEGGAIPYRQDALAKRQENFEQRATLAPESRCYLPGVPRITYMPHPFQIVQQADKITILYEYLHTIRHIYMDGKPHPPGPIEWWMGDSRGHWEGDTLVVDVVHFTGETWFDRAGNYHSNALHVVERYTPMGTDHLHYEATIEDPNIFTRPWTIAMPLYRRQEQNSELLEYQCNAYLLDEEWDKEDSAFFE